MPKMKTYCSSKVKKKVGFFFFFFHSLSSFLKKHYCSSKKKKNTTISLSFFTLFALSSSPFLFFFPNLNSLKKCIERDQWPAACGAMVFENCDGVDIWWWCSGGLGCWVLWVSNLLVVDFGSLICGFHMSLCLIYFF